MQIQEFGMQWFQDVLRVSFMTYMESFLRRLPDLFLACLLLFVGLIGIRIFRRSVERVLARLRVAPNLMQLTLNGVNAGSLAILGIVVLSVAGVQLSVIMTALGGVSIALGIALRDNISNLADGIMIMSFKHYQVGDVIESVGISGTVEKIGVFYTTVKTPQAQKIVVPNSKMVALAVTNFSVYASRRVDLDVELAIGADVGLAKLEMVRVFRDHALVLRSPEPAVLTLGLRGAVTLQGQVWCQRDHFLEVRSALYDELKRVFLTHGIPFNEPRP